jgi:hypothetical protein
MASRQVKVGQYYIEKKDPDDPTRPGDIAEVLHVNTYSKSERLLFVKMIYFSSTRKPKYQIYLTGFKERNFLKVFKHLSKENYLRFIISEGIDPNRFDDDE